jgi:hypothetical protein
VVRRPRAPGPPDVMVDVSTEEGAAIARASRFSPPLTWPDGTFLTPGETTGQWTRINPWTVTVTRRYEVDNFLDAEWYPWDEGLIGIEQGRIVHVVDAETERRRVIELPELVSDGLAWVDGLRRVVLFDRRCNHEGESPRGWVCAVDPTHMGERRSFGIGSRHVVAITHDYVVVASPDVRIDAPVRRVFMVRFSDKAEREIALPEGVETVVESSVHEGVDGSVVVPFEMREARGVVIARWDNDQHIVAPTGTVYVDMLDAERAVAISSDTLWKSEDSGASWHIVRPPSPLLPDDVPDLWCAGRVCVAWHRWVIRNWNLPIAPIRSP